MKIKTILANQSKTRTPRHRAREFVLQGIYQWLINNKDISLIDQHVRDGYGFNKADEKFFEILLYGIISNLELLQAEFLPFIDREICQLSPVEHSVLLIGTFELKNLEEIPYKVIINEAVELTKSFGGIDGHKYVNGVLDKLANLIRQSEISFQH
tara:strand:+ start:176 stop:640 length:465 start_codon:yes stop_codon:yes gene_type:complete